MARLDRFDLDGALRIGRTLKKRRHTSGFEILARAYQGKGDAEKAVEILEEGVSVAPVPPILWEQLGCYYSDLQRYDEAESAFRRALEGDSARRSSILLNLAVLYSRIGRPAEALEAVNSMDPQEIDRLFAEATRLDALVELGRYEEAILAADEAIRCKEQEQDLDRSVSGRGAESVSAKEMLARIYAERGRAIWLGRRDGEAALRDAWRTVELDGRNSQSAWLIRDIEDLRSPNGKYFRILAEGRWHEPIEGSKSEKPPGFYVNYDVVADSEAEALAFIRRFEPAEVRDSLKIEETEVLEARAGEPKGVYRVNGGYCFFEAAARIR